MEVEELVDIKMLSCLDTPRNIVGKISNPLTLKKLMLTLKTMKIYCSQKIMWWNYHLFTELKRIINCSIKFSIGEYSEDISNKLLKMISREKKPSHIY